MHPLFLSFASIFQIILINIVLSGDNALVVALAARRLPVDQRRKAMIWGVALAVSMQTLFTIVVSYLLVIPGLQLVGAIMLGVIACRLLQEEVESAREAQPTPSSLKKAIARIAIADLVMSLDNVLAVAGVSKSEPFQLIMGLAISVGILLASSTAIISLMNRFRWITLAGTAILALTASTMMSQDLALLILPATSHASASAMPVWADWSLRLFFLTVCLTSVRWWPALQAIRWNGLVTRATLMDRPEALVEV